MVYVERFELSTLWPQTRCANQTALYVDLKHGGEYWIRTNGDPFGISGFTIPHNRPL